MATLVAVGSSLAATPLATRDRCRSGVRIPRFVVAADLRRRHDREKIPMATTTLPTAPPASRTATGSRLAAGAAGLAALVAVASGVTQLLYPQDLDPAIDPRTRVLLVATTLLLWALAVVYTELGRYARSPWGARVAAAGTVLLTVGTLSSAVNGIDFAFFPPVAITANALWFAGAVWLVVSLLRAGRVSRVVALLLLIVQPATLFFSQMGGGILSGAYLAVLGFLLARGQLGRSQG